MPHASFVHLRVHSAYSLSEGAIRLDELAKLCRKFAAPAVAVTDTNNLFGALEFSHAAHAAGVQPIIGCQLALAHDERGGARPGLRAGREKRVRVRPGRGSGPERRRISQSSQADPHRPFRRDRRRGAC